MVVELTVEIDKYLNYWPITDPIVHIIKICITQAIWLNKLKEAEIIPIYKIHSFCTKKITCVFLPFNNVRH